MGSAKNLVSNEKILNNIYLYNMSIKNLILNLQIIIPISIFLISCTSNNTQKKVSSQLSGVNSPKSYIKNLPTKAPDSKNKQIKKINQNKKKIENENSFEEYVNALLKNNKSKGFPDINSIPN